MTNQMKMMLKFAFGVYLFSAIVTFGLCVASLFNFSIYGYLFAVSSIVLTIVSYICIKKQQQIDAQFLIKVDEIKQLIALRERAIIAFYHRHGLEPVYINGKLVEPDDFVGILTKVDENGNLVASIYDYLNIEPKFGKNGKEIPTIFVVKNLVRNFKSKNLDKLSLKKMVNKASIKKKFEVEKKDSSKTKASVVKKKANIKKFVPVSKYRYAVTKYKAKKVKYTSFLNPAFIVKSKKKSKTANKKVEKKSTPNNVQKVVTPSPIQPIVKPQNTAQNTAVSTPQNTSNDTKVVKTTSDELKPKVTFEANFE